MKFSIFGPVSYQGHLERGWPIAPRHFDPECGPLSMRRAFEVFETAHQVGFDSLTVAEHHYAPRQLTPDPVAFAAALSQRIPGAHISVLGCNLPLNNPIRIAEQFAMLDNLLEGRLAVGVFRGTPQEYVTYSTNPAESRAMFNESVELLLRALTEPEPFAWEGVHYRYRTVSIWPQPYQRPRMPVLTSGGSIDSIVFAARHHLDIGFFMLPLDVVARLVTIYRDEAHTHGWDPTPDNILYRHAAYIGETDEQAIADCARYEFGTVLGILKPRPERAADQAALISAVMSGWAKDRAAPPALLAAGSEPGLPMFVGSPDTVAMRLTEAGAQTGVGRFDLIFTGDTLPHELGLRSVRLFGEEVLSRCR